MADKKIEPELIKVGPYLETQEMFVVPEYQRPYSWHISTCDKLFSDVDDYMNSLSDSGGVGGDPYFFGSIILDCSESGELRLIDGQQRTATFLLLLSALKLRLLDAFEETKNDEESKTLHKAIERHLMTIFEIFYHPGEEGWKYLEDTSQFRNSSFRFENRSINEVQDFVNDLRKIVEARSFNELEPTVFRFKRRQLDNKYSPYFRNFKYFYNQFGEYGHNGASYIKKFADTLLNNCQLIVIKSWNFSQAINMFNSLNSDGQPLTDSDIISAKLFANSHGSDEQNTAWKALIRSIDGLPSGYRFDITDILNQYMYIDRAENGFTQMTVQGLRTFYLKKRANSREYTNPGLLMDPSGFVTALQHLVDNWDLAANCPGIVQLLRLNYNARYFVATFMHRKGLDLKNPSDMALLQDVVNQLLRLFVVLESGDWGYSSNLFKGFLFNENVRLVDSGVSGSALVEDFSHHLTNSFRQEELRARLDDYRDYSLVYVNEYLTDPVASPKVSADVQIEHIMPQSGNNIEVIRKDAGLPDVEEFEDYKNRLGNLILLESSINITIGNSWFASKLDGYEQSLYPCARELFTQGGRSWTRDDIDQRTAAISDRLTNFVFDCTTIAG